MVATSVFGVETWAIIHGWRMLQIALFAKMEFIPLARRQCNEIRSGLRDGREFANWNEPGYNEEKLVCVRSPAPNSKRAFVSSWWSFELKNIALIGVGLGLGVAGMTLFADQPTPRLMAVQCLAWTFAATCLILYLGLQLRRDLVPDYLGLCKDKFFERDGFCFGISLDREDAVAMFTIMFQNRYLGPATARIALRPTGAGVATVSPDIQCGPAGFGVAKFPVAIPRRHQGKTVTFEIGVDAEYPLGKGREVRFRSGRTIRHNARFRSLTVVVQALLHSLVGHFLMHRPTTIRLTLPSHVAQYVPDGAVGGSEVLWSLSENEPLRYAMER